MAGQGTGDTESRVIRVWTFRIRGGPSFDLSLPNNPSLRHDSNTTVWKLLGTQDTADAAAGLMRSLGVTVDVFSESQSDDQRDERRVLLGLQ